MIVSLCRGHQKAGGELHHTVFGVAGRSGYSLVSTRNQVQMAAGFSNWLGQNRIDLADIRGEHAGHYLQERAQFRRPRRGDDAALRHLLDFLRGIGAIREEAEDERQPSSIDLKLQAYESYLRDARALNRQTIINYRPVVRDFLNFRFSDGAVSLAELRAVDVTDFVQKRTSRLNIRRAKIMTTALRSFLSYARYNGDITSDLAAAVPIVANWRLSSIPRAIGRDDVTRLLASIDRQTPMGRRDYAMILMLARLGLRSSEVITLELGDIDWVAGQIRVRGKSGQRNDLPLSADVGEAIADYLRNGRPRSACRRVFLRDKARSGDSTVRVDLDAPSAVAFNGLASMLPQRVRTSSVTVSLPRCCVAAPRSARSAKFWAPPCGDNGDLRQG